MAASQVWNLRFQWAGLGWVVCALGPYRIGEDISGLTAALGMHGVPALWFRCSLF